MSDRVHVSEFAIFHHFQLVGVAHIVRDVVHDQKHKGRYEHQVRNSSLDTLLALFLRVLLRDQFLGKS